MDQIPKRTLLRWGRIECSEQPAQASESREVVVLDREYASQK
jgi:hypothetical protein